MSQFAEMQCEINRQRKEIQALDRKIELIKVVIYNYEYEPISERAALAGGCLDTIKEITEC